MIDYKDNFRKRIYKIWGLGKTPLSQNILRLTEQLSYKIIQTYVISTYARTTNITLNGQKCL